MEIAQRTSKPANRKDKRQNTIEVSKDKRKGRLPPYSKNQRVYGYFWISQRHEKVGFTKPLFLRHTAVCIFLQYRTTTPTVHFLLRMHLTRAATRVRRVVASTSIRGGHARSLSSGTIACIEDLRVLAVRQLCENTKSTGRTAAA